MPTRATLHGSQGDVEEVTTCAGCGLRFRDARAFEIHAVGVRLRSTSGLPRRCHHSEDLVRLGLKWDGTAWTTKLRAHSSR